MVLILRGNIASVANAFAAELGSDATVHVLGSGGEPDEGLDPRIRHARADSWRASLDYLMQIDRPQAIIEAGSKQRENKLLSYRHLFYFVTPGGFYAVEELNACGDPRYDDDKGESVVKLVTKVVAAASMAKPSAEKARAYVRHLAAHTGVVEFSGGGVALERRGERLAVKLRDAESNRVLTSRYGDDWGEVLETRPAFEFISRTEVVSHGGGPIPSGRRTFSVPERHLRHYREVTCTAQQIVRRGDYFLPDSWRHPHRRTLHNRQLANVSPYFDKYRDDSQPSSTRRLPGAFYYLDTELPRHFGHITTEVLSRVWGWQMAVAADPSVRVLMSTHRKVSAIPAFQRSIFLALGLPVDDLVVIDPREAVTVESLYAATPQFENPVFVDPDLARVWATLGANLPMVRPATSEKIFISRRPSDKRHCRQTAAVEAFFARHGFEIVFPEDHPYPDQKAMFAGARVIGGFGGSGMFNAMFAPGAKLVIISGDSYTAENEHLIAAANGNELHYFWGRSDIPMPEKSFSLPAFTSAFDFDLRRHRRALVRAFR